MSIVCEYCNDRGCLVCGIVRRQDTVITEERQGEVLYQYSENQGECLIRMREGKSCDMDDFYVKYVAEALSDFPSLLDGKIARGQFGYRLDKPIFGITFTPPAGCEIPEKYVRVEKLSTPFHQ